MAKRFTDTDKWKKPFIRNMKSAYKLLWFYIIDDCDHAGIWQVDLDVAMVRTGETFCIEDALENFGEKVLVFDNGQKWFIPDFIEFQYGQLNPENRAHNSVIKIIEKHELISHRDKPLISPLQGAMDKDKDIDITSLTNSDKIFKKIKHLQITEGEVAKILDQGYSLSNISDILDAISNFKNNHKYVSLYLTALNWLKKEHGAVVKSINNSKPMTDDEYTAFINGR